MENIIYFLSRIILNLFLPPSLPIIFLSLGIIKNRKKYLYYSLFILILLSSSIFSECLIRIAEFPFKYKSISSIPKAEFIVVLSSLDQKLNSSDEEDFEFIDSRRFFAGYNLFKSGKANKIIFTSAYKKFQKIKELEGNLLRSKALSLGLSESDILVTNPVLNTFDESNKVKELILKNGFNVDEVKIVLVTSAFHMQRALFLFRDQNMNIIPFPMDFKSNQEGFFSTLKNPLNWIPNSNNLHLSSISIKELLARTYFYTKNHFSFK